MAVGLCRQVADSPVYWLGRIAEDLHLNPYTLRLAHMLRSVLFLLRKDVGGEFGLVLSEAPPPDECAMLDLTPEERSDEMQRYHLELCSAVRILNFDELNAWLADGTLPAVTAVSG